MAEHSFRSGMGTDQDTDGPTPAIKRARTRGAGPIFVCGKCLKRVSDGKAFRRALKEAARDRIEGLAAQGRVADGRGGSRKVRVVRTSCLGLCPKCAVVLASAATLGTGEMLIVADSGAVADAMMRLIPGDATKTATPAQ